MTGRKERMADAKAKSREEAKQETRAALVQAGFTLFVDQGVDSPSLDAICAEAGYTRGAFYVHFKDRDDFILACINDLLQAFIGGVIATGNGAKDLGETVDRFVDAASIKSLPGQVTNPKGQGGGLLQFLATSMHRNEEVRRRYAFLLRKAVAGVAEATAAGQAAGSVRADVTPAQAGVIIVAAGMGLSTMLDVGIDVDLEGVRDLAHKVVAPTVATGPDAASTRAATDPSKASEAPGEDDAAGA